MSLFLSSLPDICPQDSRAETVETDKIERNIYKNIYTSGTIKIYSHISGTIKIYLHISCTIKICIYVTFPQHNQ